jgi:hypothetical protein
LHRSRNQLPKPFAVKGFRCAVSRNVFTPRDEASSTSRNCLSNGIVKTLPDVVEVFCGVKVIHVPSAITPERVETFAQFVCDKIDATDVQGRKLIAIGHFLRRGR